MGLSRKNFIDSPPQQEEDNHDNEPSDIITYVMGGGEKLTATNGKKCMGKSIYMTRWC